MNGENQVTAKKNTEKQMRSLLDDFLDQKDESGNVISQAAITDLSFLLWMVSVVTPFLCICIAINVVSYVFWAIN